MGGYRMEKKITPMFEIDYNYNFFKKITFLLLFIFSDWPLTLDASLIVEFDLAKSMLALLMKNGIDIHISSKKTIKKIRK